MRFLFTRRWVLFALAVAALAWLATELGQWQFHRLDDRRAENSRVAANLDQPPVPITDLMAVGEPVPVQHEWRKVIVHGTWDDENTLVLKYQTRSGAPGVDVVTPLVTDSGAAVLVDRGWLSTANNGGERPELPAATDGQVTVIGWVRVDGTGRATAVNNLETRALSSSAVAEVLDVPLYGGFLDLSSERPVPAEVLELAELPDDTSEGPHFFYGLQWWFFALLAVTGFGYLAYDEARMAREKKAREDQPPVPGTGLGTDPDGSEGAEHPAVHREHHAGHE